MTTFDKLKQQNIVVFVKKVLQKTTIYDKVKSQGGHTNVVY